MPLISFLDSLRILWDNIGQKTKNLSWISSVKFSLYFVRNGLFKWQLVPIWVRRCLLCVKPVKYRVKFFQGVGKVWESENISSNDDVENYEIFVYVIFEIIFFLELFHAKIHQSILTFFETISGVLTLRHTFAISDTSAKFTAF